MRWLAGIAIVVGCQAPPRPPPPAVFARAGFESDLPACAPGAPARCRDDRVTDVDRDGVADCWRRTPGTAYVWPKCENGAPERIEFWGELGEVSGIELPEALRAPAWARGVASIIADRVACESPVPGCAPPSSIARLVLARMHARPGWSTFDLDWRADPPAPVAREVVVLDPIDERGVTESHLVRLLTARLLLIDPAKAEDDPSWRVPCEDYELRQRGGVLFATNKATGFTAPIYVSHGYIDAACAEDIVVIQSGWGTDTEGVIVINPITGTIGSFATRAKPREIASRGELHERRHHVLRQLHTAMQPWPVPVPACTGAPPLLALAPRTPCELRGRADVDGDGTDDCWTATWDLQGWSIDVERGCKELGASLDVDTSGGTRVVTSADDTRPTPTSWWLAHLVAGDQLRCVVPARGCPAADPIAAWFVPRYDEPHPLRWIPGTPAMPPRSLSMLPGDGERYTRFVLFDPVTPVDHRSAELAPAGPCGDLELWSSPIAIAVADRRAHRWAWVYATGWVDHPDEAAERTIVDARCEGGLITWRMSGEGTWSSSFDALDGSEPWVFDPKTGDLAVITAAVPGATFGERAHAAFFAPRR